MSTVKNQSPEKIKEFILLEIGDQNSSQIIIKNVMESIVQFPEQWEISGISFVVPPKNEYVIYSAQFLPTEWNNEYDGYLSVQVKLINKASNVEQPIYLTTETWAVGKAWGTGSANHEVYPNEMMIDLDRFGGINLFKENYSKINITVEGSYMFKSGKHWGWDIWNINKVDYKEEVVLFIDNKAEMGKWVEVKSETSQLGGANWGNYYRSYIFLEFIDGKLKLTIKYEIAAYGIGSNWYWTGGAFRANKIEYIAK